MPPQEYPSLLRGFLAKRSAKRCGKSTWHELISESLGNIARAKGMTQLARETGISREGLYKALSAGDNPTIRKVQKNSGRFGIQAFYGDCLKSCFCFGIGLHCTIDRTVPLARRGAPKAPPRQIMQVIKCKSVIGQTAPLGTLIHPSVSTNI